MENKNQTIILETVVIIVSLIATAIKEINRITSD